jgi:hypothetical protein
MTIPTITPEAYEAWRAEQVRDPDGLAKMLDALEKEQPTLHELICMYGKTREEGTAPEDNYFNPKTVTAALSVYFLVKRALEVRELAG